MKRRKSNGRGANGEARTHELLERIANEIGSMRKEFKSEIRTLREDLKTEIRATNERIDATNGRLDATNERIDHLIEILAPKLKDHDDRLTRLEQGRAA